MAKQRLDLGFEASKGSVSIKITTELYDLGIYIIQKPEVWTPKSSFKKLTQTTRNTTDKANKYVAKLRQQFKEEGYSIKEYGYITIRFDDKTLKFKLK